MVTLRVLLRDLETGDEAWHEEQHDSEDAAEFYWMDGNGGCDCERLRIIRAEHGQPDPDIPCGDSRVIIVRATLDGKPYLLDLRV